GVVGDDAADLCRVDRGRVRADLAAQRCQHGVGVGADHAGLQADLFATVANLATVPVVTQHDQYRVGNRLAGEAGAGGAEGHGDLFGVRPLEQLDHFGFGVDANHKLV